MMLRTLFIAIRTRLARASDCNYVCLPTCTAARALSRASYVPYTLSYIRPLLSTRALPRVESVAILSCHMPRICHLFSVSCAYYVAMLCILRCHVFAMYLVSCIWHLFPPTGAFAPRVCVSYVAILYCLSLSLFCHPPLGGGGTQPSSMCHVFGG